MKPLEIRPLKNSDEKSFKQAIKEFESDIPPWQFAFNYDPNQKFSSYVEHINSWPQGIGLAEDWVPNTFLVAVVGDIIIGRVSIRHKLNNFLEQYGGHIGYGVVPSQRRQGYAKEILKLSIPLLREIGIAKALISCDTDNTASRKVIEKNGGIFERITSIPDLEKQKRIYWIQTENINSNQNVSQTR